MKKILTATLLGGFVAGALDITYACLHYNIAFDTPPMRILQSVAGGLLGREAARAGGWNTALLGLALHFMIALIMAGFFVVVAQRLKFLTRQAWLWGPLYGLGLYVVMQYLVLPLSANHGGGGPDAFDQFFWGAIFAHTILVGLPIALVARHFAARD